MTQTSSTALMGAVNLTKAFISFKDFSKRFIRISNLSSREAGICWRSKEFEGEEEERGGSFVLTLESVTRLHKYLTLDLLSIIDKPSQGCWMFSVLGSSVFFVASSSISITGGRIGGPSYELPLRVVMALASFLGFGMVLLGRELELEALLL
nr:hypothetical protein [Tanacetum cinerariifolium]